MARIFNVLFICTGNSARSIMAEAILNQSGGQGFRAYSAGSKPAGRIHPLVLDILRRHHLDPTDLRSKSWSEFGQPGAPMMDFVITVCDRAAGEVCPVWPGQPVSAHWGVEDPVEVQGSPQERERAFSQAFMLLHRRIALLRALPLEKLDRLSLQHELHQIAKVAASA